MTPHLCLTPYDWPALLALIQSAFAGMEGRIDPPSSMKTLTPALIEAQSRTGQVWAIGTPPVACVFLTPKSDALYIGKLAVATPHRGQGHARVLIGVAADQARALGLPWLELQTRIELFENHATFRALGFAETARSAHPGYTRPTTLTFRKPV